MSSIFFVCLKWKTKQINIYIVYYVIQKEFFFFFRLPAGSNELKCPVLNLPTVFSSGWDKQYNYMTSRGVQSSIIGSVWHFCLLFFFVLFLFSKEKKTKHNKTRKWRIMIDVSILLMQSYHFLNERKTKVNQSNSSFFSCHILLLDANWSGSPNRSGYERLTFNADVYCNSCFNKRSSSWRNCASFRWISFVLACLAFSISL